MHAILQGLSQGFRVFGLGVVAALFWAGAGIVKAGEINHSMIEVYPLGYFSLSGSSRGFREDVGVAARIWGARYIGAVFSKCPLKEKCNSTTPQVHPLCMRRQVPNYLPTFADLIHGALDTTTFRALGFTPGTPRHQRMYLMA